MAAAGAPAHELPANRLTVVQREPAHLQLSFHIDYLQALQRVLAPGSDVRAFALAHAALEAAQLAPLLQRAHAQLEAGTRLLLPGGQAVPASGWRWPATAQAQALLQQQVMRALVAPQDRAHEAPTEVRAEIALRLPLAAPPPPLQLQLPAVLQPVLVVSYRPSQTWSQPGAGAVLLRF